MNKPIPKEKKCKKAKCFSEEALQIAEKRRETKSKGEKERYTKLNAEFQRIARRDKKAFLNEQCKEIEENNRMGKADLFNKMGYIKGTFHARLYDIYCLFNLYAEYIMQTARLDESQAIIRIAGRNINNLQYADTTLMAEGEELKSLLMNSEGGE